MPSLPQTQYPLERTHMDTFICSLIRCEATSSPIRAFHPPPAGHEVRERRGHTHTQRGGGGAPARSGSMPWAQRLLPGQPGAREPGAGPRPPPGKGEGSPGPGSRDECVGGCGRGSVVRRIPSDPSRTWFPHLGSRPLPMQLTSRVCLAKQIEP